MRDSSGPRSDIFFMLLSTGLLAYFGFGSSWVHKYTTTQPPQFLPMVALLEWALKGGAIAFGISTVLVMLRQRLGDVLYSIAGLATAACFLIVAVWEWTNPQGYFSGVPAILLLLFAVWNGYGSWSSLREIMAKPAARPAA